MLSFGAQAGMRNGDNESVVDVINKHPQHRQEDYFKIVHKFRGQQPRVARVRYISSCYIYHAVYILGTDGKEKKYVY